MTLFSFFILIIQKISLIIRKKDFEELLISSPYYRVNHDFITFNIFLKIGDVFKGEKYEYAFIVLISTLDIKSKNKRP